MIVTVRLLGPVEADADGVPVPLPGARPRALLAVLAASSGMPVTAERLAEAVWSDTGRPGARGTLQVHVHTLRHALGSGAVRHGPAGYALADARVDVRAAEDDLRRARATDRAGDAVGAADAYRAALSHWRGPLCADLPDHAAFEPARALYASLRLEALEGRIGADLRVGPAPAVVPELDDLVAAHPLRERLWGLLMVALHREGRPADALACYRRARAVLAEHAGLDPGAALRELERAVLARAGTTDLLRVVAPAGAPTGRPQLTWVAPGGLARARELPASGRVRLGRDPDADVPLLGDASVSRSHAAVTVDDGTARLLDLGSRNGTFCNGVRVPVGGTPLRAGDLLRCGDSVLAVAVGAVPAPVDGETRPGRSSR